MSITLSERVFDLLFGKFLSDYDHPEQAENLFYLIFHEILFLGIDGLYKYQDELIPHHFQSILDSLKDSLIYTQLRECISSKVNGNIDFYEKYIVEAADRAQLNYERRRVMLKEGLLEFLKSGKFKQGDLKIPPKQLCSFNDIMSELVNEEVTREYYLSIFKKSLIKALDQILNEFADNYKPDIRFRMNQVNFNLLDAGPEAIQDHKSFLWPEHLNRLEEFICQEPYSLYITLKKNSNRECSPQKEMKPSPVFTKIEERARIHKEMFEETTVMPHCLNRSIIRLIYNVEMRILQNIPWVTVESFKFNLDNEMRNEIQFLEQYSKAEGPSKADALEAIKCFQSRSTDWEFVLRNLEKILRNIHVLNLTKIKCLLKNLDETISIVKNQHVIVFLGNSGSGKSTTIHFLAGSKMTKTKIDNIPTIQPISESNDPFLKKVRVSPLPVSETRDVISIEVKLDSVFHERNKIVLLDTPGFEDTEGPEVDIANRIKLINTLRAAASVKIVLVHSSKNGERSTGIRRLVKSLEEIFPSIEEYGSTFTHFFTKYPSNSEDQEATIRELKSINCDSEPKEFQALISTMKRAACHFIEPLNSDLRLDLLRELAKTDNIILFPEEAFKFGASSCSMRVFENQVLTHQQEIFVALNDSAPDYALVKYKLDELKFLDEILHESRIVHEKYDKCVAELRTKIMKICGSVIVGFKEMLLKGAVPVDEEIEKYKYLQQIERVMKTHLREGFHPTHQIKLQIVNFSQDISEKFSKCSRDEVFNHNIELNGLKIISDIFDETSVCYHQSCKDLQTLIDNSIVALKDLIFTNKFEILASEINQINRFKDEFHDHAWSTEIEKKFDQSKECLKSALDMPSDLSATLTNNLILSTDDISKFDQFFAKLDSAMISFKGTQLEEEFAHMHKFWTQEITMIFKNLTEDVKENLRKPSFEQQFARIEPNVKYTISICKISSIRLRVSYEFSGLKNALRDKLTELKSKIDLLFLQNFHDLNTFHNSAELISSLKCLISTKWLEDLQLLDYPEFISSLTQSIASILKSFGERTFDFEIHEVEIFSQRLLSRIKSEIPILNTLFPEIALLVSQAEESFIDKIMKEISSILEKTERHNSDPKRLKLKTCTRAMIFLDSCSIIPSLKEKSFEQKEILISSIKKGYIASKLAELESLNESISNSAEHEDKISSDVTQFVCSFNEVIDIQNEYPEIFSLFPNYKSLINYWKIRLSEQFDTFDTEMRQLLDIQNFSALKNKILFAKSLRGLDLYLNETKSYQELGKQYNCKLTSEIDQIRTQLERNLEDFEYKTVADNLEILESLGIKDVIYQNKYKNSLWELTQQTKNSIVKLIKLTVEEGDSIWKKLKSLESSFKYMREYNEEITQEMIFGDIRLILDEKVKWFTDGINGLLHAHKFTEAEDELCQINVIKQLLGKYMSTETITLIEQLVINKNEFVTKELVEHFSNVDNLPYIGDDLKQLLIRLHDAKEKNTCDIYNKAYRDINSKLVSNFKDRLDKLSQTPEALQKHLPKLKKALNALPINLQSALNEDIEVFYRSKCFDDLL